MDEKQLREIEQRVHPVVAHQQAEREAAERWAEPLNYSAWHFAIVGAELPEAREIPYGSIGMLRPVGVRPSIFTVAGALADQSIYEIAGKWSSMISAELTIYHQEGKDPNITLQIGYYAVSLLRVRTHCEFLVPMAADKSWNTLILAPEHSVHCALLENAFHTKRLRAPTAISLVDIGWCSDHLTTLLGLTSNQAFTFALEVFSQYHTSMTLRHAASSIWSGIEAIVHVTPETTFRLSTYLACWLFNAGPQRQESYNRIKFLYGERSKVVHGGDLKGRTLAEHVIESSELLRLLILSCIERNCIPSQTEFESRFLL